MPCERQGRKALRPRKTGGRVFTGLIEACVPIRRIEASGTGLRLTIAAPGPDFAVERGQSIAVSGACLTVIDPSPGQRPGTGHSSKPLDIAFDLSAETLARTWFGTAAPGRSVNLERALRLGDRLDGHLVAGHVDGVGRVVSSEDSADGGRRMRFEVPPGLERYLIDKGSITIDGVSLTVVSPSARHFDVAVIPLTLEKTGLGRARAGAPVHIEADMIGKWLDRLRT